jgi:hypothetical protein
MAPVSINGFKADKQCSPFLYPLLPVFNYSLDQTIPYLDIDPKTGIISPNCNSPPLTNTIVPIKVTGTLPNN